MLRLTIYIRPHRLEQVKSAIAALGVSGMTVSDVRGTGNSPEQTQWFAGEGHVIPLPIRSKIDVVIPDGMKEQVVEAVLASAQTGEHSDGKIFVEPIADAIRVRTGEQGEQAL
jgi:nitrogen regulatory protein PII